MHSSRDPVASVEHVARTLRDIRGGPRPDLDPQHAALIIIDAQEEYLRGPLRLEDVEAAIDEVDRLRAWAREHGVFVVHVRQVSAADAPVFARGSQGADIVARLLPSSDEAVVDKAYPNAFNRTGLDALLRGAGRHQLLLTGFMAHMCLDSTARAAFDRDYSVFIVASATAERSIPDPEGAVVSAGVLLRATLTALNDRFAWILPDARAVAGP